ncbi:ATP synthase subunit I [Aquibacillus rhizosphaerae]|uniref:ATP synthase subunit I n=1 Tax=Aquibacillus rhizosphaerae TaxID=3051431 RepID=A0ABT7L1X8_9BACI|nr:ATP synthase subunit I [Aquibacillus sp. LR5S19]MDL4839150.1 ATP synthase subunit I [Aquibacillus sp. LR5S19]
MQDEIYKKMINRQRKWMLYFISVLVLGAGFTPYTTVFLGLLLGSVLSFFNLWVLQKKINKFGQAVIEGKRILGIGTVTRLTVAVLAVVTALRFDDYFHVISVIIGLMTTYIVIMIDFSIFETKTNT